MDTPPRASASRAIGVMVGGPTLVDVIAPAEPDTARRPFRSGRVRREEHVGRR
ncbi:hypothetical protein ACFYZN_36290 [Streptomyces sp. NPDC001777]|uniref:hypothetical protein n=1 Tax=Streptomyces sp. NPDC001777 TaxID=3364608 RepID=UPI0036BC5FFC